MCAARASGVSTKFHMIHVELFGCAVFVFMNDFCFKFPTNLLDSMMSMHNNHLHVSLRELSCHLVSAPWLLSIADSEVRSKGQESHLKATICLCLDMSHTHRYY